MSHQQKGPKLGIEAGYEQALRACIGLRRVSHVAFSEPLLMQDMKIHW